VQRLAVSSSSAASDDPEPGAGPSLLTARGSRRQAQHHRSRCAADEVRPGLSGFSLVIAFKARRSLAPSLAPNHAKASRVGVTEPLRGQHLEVVEGQCDPVPSTVWKFEITMRYGSKRSKPGGNLPQQIATKR
jgi:hypothetical protein